MPEVIIVRTETDKALEYIIDKVLGIGIPVELNECTFTPEVGGDIPPEDTSVDENVTTLEGNNAFLQNDTSTEKIPVTSTDTVKQVPTEEAVDTTTYVPVEATTEHYRYYSCGPTETTSVCNTTPVADTSTTATTTVSSASATESTNVTTTVDTSATIEATATVVAQ